MELIFKNKIVQYDELPSPEEIMTKINELLTDQYYYSHLIVDEVEVYEEPESYFLKRQESISTIEIAVKTVQEFVNEVLIMADNYLKRAIPEMKVLADGFYQNPKADKWNDFSVMLEGMQWLNQLVDSIDKAKERPGNWNECIKHAFQLEIELKNLEKAVVNIDSVLIADIIQYELLPVYEALRVEFNKSIDTEGELYDFN